MSSRLIRRLGAHLPLVWATLLAGLLLGPALAPGYVLTYDLVWVPHLSLRGDFLGFGTALPRAVPSDAVVSVLDNLVPAMLLEKVALLAPLVAAGAGTARLVGGSLAVRLTAVTLAVWNPFTVERLGIGHWTVLIGYGVLPWLVLAGRRLRRTGRLSAVAWVLVPLGALSASAGLVTAVTLLVSGWQSGGQRGRANLTLVTCAVAGNAPWLVAGLLHADNATGSSTSVFALHPEGSLPAPLAALGMGGIWNADVVPGSRETFIGWLALLLLVCLAAVGFGAWRRRPDGDARRLCLLWALGFALACVTWLLPGLTDWLAGHVAGGGLLRDGTRNLALCLPVYAGLPAVGIGVLADRAGSTTEVGVRRAVAAAGALLPLLLLYDAGWGLAGALRPVDYPAAWAQVRAQTRFGDGDLLVLPLSAYRAPAWNHGHTVLDPLARYLAPDALTADALLVDGTAVPGEDPRVPRVESALRLPTASARTRALLDLGVQYVATETDVGSAPPPLAATPLASSGALTVERLDGTAVARTPTLVARLATGAAWTAYLLSLLGGLAAAGIGRARTGRRQMRTDPPAHVG